MNNENTWTQGGEHYTLGSIGGIGEGEQAGELGRESEGGELGRDCMGRNARSG